MLFGLSDLISNSLINSLKVLIIPWIKNIENGNEAKIKIKK